MAGDEQAAEQEHVLGGDGWCSCGYVLPEQRHQWYVRTSSHGVTHVIYASTFKAFSHEGQWTRKGFDRSALCGSMRVFLVGVDAANWRTERQPLDIAAVNCKRCRASYKAWERRTRPGDHT